jgi:hypothetical protein
MNIAQKLLTAFAAWLSLAGVSSAALTAQFKLQDNAADTVVVATVGTNGALTGAGNTSATSVADGPGTLLTRSFLFTTGSDRVDSTTGNTGVVQNASVVTLCCWFKTTTGDTTGTHALVYASINASGNTRSGLFINSTGNLLCYARAGDAEAAQIKTSTSAYDDNAWHHAAVVINYAADTTTFYVDGSSVGATGTIAFTGTATPNTGSQHVTMGQANTSDTYTGKLADCRYYNSDESANLATIMAEADVATSAVAKILLQLSDARLRKQSKHFDTYGVYALSP